VIAAGLALVLAVVLLSAAIRLGQTAAPPLSDGILLILRGFHRTAASLEVLVAAWLSWFAWRIRSERPALARGIALAAGLTIALSVLGIVAGRTPPPAAAMGNLLGGLALAAVFAWLLAESRSPGAQAAGRAAWIWILLIAAQCVLGARLAVFSGAGSSAALPAHAMLGILLAAGGVWLAQHSAHLPRRWAGTALALLVPIAGFTALHYEDSSSAAFAHAAAAAVLIAVAAYTRLRST
jgi:heme A synthase